MDGYTTLKQAAEAQMIEKRSRFIGAAAPVENEEQAVGFIAKIRGSHRDASHNCYAYSLRDGVLRYSDDGEPQGTAGVPILEVLRREELVNSVIVVTRYFGGTLLGANGLVRAYSSAARLAVEAAGKLMLKPCTLFSLKLAYHFYGKAGAVLQGFGAEILESDFGEVITLRLKIPSADFPGLSRELAELSSGVLAPEAIGEEFG